MLISSAIVLGGHIGMDFIKDWKWRPERSIEWLIVDQLIHFLLIFVVFLPSNFEANFIFDGSPWEYTGLFAKWICVIILLFKVWPMVVGGLLKQLKLGEEDKLEDSSLKRAGAYIGHLERILIFIFIVTGHWEGVGFLLAAKSIFRYGDLTRKEHRMQTEYVLLGTLTSFIGGILTAQLYIVL